MSLFFGGVASSQRLQLAVTSILSAGIAVGVVLSYQQLRREIRVKRLKDSIPKDRLPDRLNEYGGAAVDTRVPSKEDENSIALALRARQGDYDNELILEQLARNRVFLSDEGLAKLRSAFVIIVGCGGVGSHAAAALARSGVSKLRLIDFDQVTLSSLNRHAVATLADVGTSKVHTIRNRLQAVTPWVHFDCRNELFDEQVAEAHLSPLNGQRPDYVIDAIDNIDSKVALLRYCSNNSIRVVSSMGAGAKSDPTRIFISDISASTDDPLSKSTRRRLRILGVKEGIPVVYSTEKSGPGKAALLPLPEEEVQKGNIDELSVLKNFRVRIMPVLGTMPAIFGLCVANHIMLDISDYPHDYPVSKLRNKMYDGILGNLQGQEERLARHSGVDSVGLRIPVTSEDVGYIVDEVYRGRSVVSGLSVRLVLTRWRKPALNSFVENIPGQRHSLLKLGELVCMTKEENSRHEKSVLQGDQAPEELYNEGVVDLVKKRMKEEETFAEFR